MKTKNDIRMEISDLLVELWADGFGAGKKDERIECKAKLTEEYDRGADEGYNDGYTDGKKGAEK